MANLHFLYGTMGSSKSAQLIINVYNFRRNNIPVEVIKPQYDTRFSNDRIVSRIGIDTPALALKNLNNYTPAADTKVIMVDEIQFFTPSDIDKLVRIAYDSNIIVMCYGLMVDSNEQIFPASRRLIEVGAKLRHLESNCQINGCVNKATHHLRFDANGNVVRAGERFSLGDSNYKSVCRTHFYHLYHGFKRRTK